MIAVLIIIIFYLLLKQKKPVDYIDTQYWDGPVPTKLEKERNLQRIFKILEEHPNGVLATKNPEYVVEYLKRINLDLPEGVEKSPE